MAASVSSDAGGFPPHIALPDAPPGMVEIWEPEKPDERREIEGWDAPFDLVNETSPRVKLARRIARHVRGLIERGAARRAAMFWFWCASAARCSRPIIRALKHEGVAVAGADRLVLTEHIAVMDLMALADALLLPQDDLALATVLRSPLFGFSDEELFTIAWNRGRVSLRDGPEQKAGEDKKFAEAAARLDELAQAARRETPFAFYAKLLGAGGARKNFLGRLGVEANDALDEFLNLALDYERRDTPSLQGFVAWLRDAQTEVKRDMEIARDEVRVMTVHGAKGLEAPIVILADTMTPPAGPKPPRLLELSGGAVIWAGRKEDDVPSVAAARDAAQERSRERISPPALCRHDARRRPADHLRRRRPDQAAGTLLVRSGARAARSVSRRGRRRRRKSFAVSQDAGRCRCGNRASRGSGKTRAARISGVAAATGARRSAASRAADALVGFRRGHFARSRQAPAPRPIGKKRWSADAWCIG